MCSVKLEESLKLYELHATSRKWEARTKLLDTDIYFILWRSDENGKQSCKILLSIMWLCGENGKAKLSDMLSYSVSLW